MRAGRLIALALVVVALGMWIYLVERHGPTTDQLQERADRVFPTLQADEIRHVEVKNSKGDFELARADAKADWKLEKPIQGDANQSAVSTLLQTLTGLKAERTLAGDQAKPADFGLVSPDLGATMTTSDGHTYRLELGATMPLGNARAASTGGSQIYLVASYVATDLEKGLDGWRANELVRLSAPDVASMTITGNGERVQLAHGKDAWQIAEPFADLADRNRAEAVIGDLSSARIATFVDDATQAAAMGLDTPRLEVTVVRNDAKDPIRLAFGDERTENGTKQVAIRRDAQLGWVPVSAMSQLTADPLAWRSKRVLAFDSWAAEGVDLRTGENHVSLTRDGGTWKAGGTDADASAISQRLRELSELEVVRFADEHPTTGESGSVSVTLEGGEKAEATFYPTAKPGEDLAVVPGRRGALVVDAAKVGAILSDPEALTRPKPTPAPAPTSTPAAPAPAAAATPSPAG